MSRAKNMNNLKYSFTIMKAIILKMILLCYAIYVCKILYVFKKPYNKPLINLDRMVITGKYQTSVFYAYCQELGLIFYRNDHTLG